MKIAVIGAGSSGLITLKTLLEHYPTEDVVCFERGYSVRGCWGNQRPDFISTSTKYTTQFSCYRKWTAGVTPTQDYAEFFRGGEFGDYLDDFTDHFGLRQHIQFGVALKQIEREEPCWRVTIVRAGNEEQLQFEAVFLCTGLVNQKVPLSSTAIPVAQAPEAIRNKTVVIVGGGESAADLANYLTKPAHRNTVYLSLRSGIRVSPRYHPIRGVPSDFLRNRLLLSFDKGFRNWLGERFVTFRIRFNQLLEKWFPQKQSEQTPTEAAQARRAEWDLKLKARSKGRLFNVFHNKSDDFLEAVGEGRLQIIGPAVDETWTQYHTFDQTETLAITPDVLVPATGYRSRLPDFSSGALHLKDFYNGCVHVAQNNLFLIGFARPIIGNIPSISEMQARYAVGVLRGEVALPPDVKERQIKVYQAMRAEYPTLDVDNVYPVEQYPYCDRLARELGSMPTLANTGLKTWLKLMLVPASSTHYRDHYFDHDALSAQQVHTPPILIGILVLLRLLGIPNRVLKGLVRDRVLRSV